MTDPNPFLLHAPKPPPRPLDRSSYRCRPSTGVQDSCGWLSYLVDKVALEPNLCFLNNLLRYQPKDEKLNWSPRHESGVRRLIGGTCVRPPCLFNWFMIRSTVMFTWTAWNDGQINDLTTNLKNSQGNIALISALLLSVFTAFLRIGDAGSDDYNVLLYVIPWTFGSIFTFMSALLAVLFLLQINELGSREEAEQYSDRMGLWLLMPILSLLLGGMSATVGVIYWLYVTIDNVKHCIIISSIVVCAMVPLLAWPLIFGVQSLYIVSETSRLFAETTSELGPRCLDGPSIKEELESYITFVGGKEYMNLEDFLEHLRVDKTIRSSFSEGPFSSSSSSYVQPPLGSSSRLRPSTIQRIASRGSEPPSVAYRKLAAPTELRAKRIFQRCLDMYVEETIDKSFEESPQQQRQQQSSVQQHDINRLRESALSTARI